MSLLQRGVVRRLGLARFGALLGALFLALAPAPAGAQAEGGNPLHGLWKVTAGPAQSASASCSADRATWFAQLGAWSVGGWLGIMHAYPTSSILGTEVFAVLPVQHRPEEWPESSRPSQAVVDQVNKLGLEYRFTGTLSADGNELSGSETQICFYWEGDELTGYQRVQVPIRATRTGYAFGMIGPDGQWIDGVKQGETFYLSFDTDEALGWQQGWVEVLDTSPTLWLKLLPDEANSRYLAGPLTIAKPPALNLDLPAEALAGRLYAEAGATLEVMVYPSLVVHAVRVAAP